MARKHFHTFDAFRFFSFLLVFFHHLPKTGISYIDFFFNSGGIGVLFFFILSGFLITYILLHEKEVTGKISLKNFFLRRVLRIWPLFYVMVAFAYVSPYLLELLHLPYQNEGYKPDIFMSVFFAENYKMMLTNNFPDGAPLRVMWSLCIEEHFYILWGIALYYISKNNVPFLIIFSIVIANIARLIYTHLQISHIDILTHIDYFAFGAIPAYLLVHKKNYLNYVENIPKRLKYLFLLITLSVLFVISNTDSIFITYISPVILGLLFSTCILLTLVNNAIHIKDTLWFSKLGTYTYALYLFHTVFILLFVQVFKFLSISNWILLALTSLIATIILSIISYHLYEKQFLKLKKYFY